MKLSDEDIASFQALYKSHFGKDIDKQEALEQGTKLVRLMELIYKPMTRAEFDTVQASRKELLKKQSFFAPVVKEKREEQPKDKPYTEKEEKFLDDAADKIADLFLTQIELEQEQKTKDERTEAQQK
jgi:hypothetical protein